MDNKAYEKYKQENPDVYTPLSTYDYIDQFVHQLTNTELVICVVAVVLAIFAIYQLFARRQHNKTETQNESKKGDL
jgi:nitrate reductase gamma subunit